ncbi:MAG: type II toxin-antitoxin system RelE/ParE family toxin [Wolbachia pipientis]|nr:type II toxin-antitoxin system RelE/ParE family toxin [Wolbachia pipientis]
MGLERYKVKFLKSVVEKDLPNFPKTMRLRVGDYRVIYRVNQLDHIVTITEIGHRDDIYKKERNINIY